jgi:hypothetical protein
MPAKEPPSPRSSNQPSPTHTWFEPKGRTLELEPGKTLIHQRCTACRRNFVNDLASGEWYAAFPRVFDFERLDEAAERWMTESCPGPSAAAEAEVRKLRQRREKPQTG